MTHRRDIAAMLTATFITWMGQRATAIALPLVALAHTGSAATTGLVGGAVGLPLLTSPWWASKLRQRITTGPALAAVLTLQVAGLLVVPIAVTIGRLHPAHLVAAGVLIGCATALSGPAQRALLADIGDTLGPAVAARMLAWQDLAHRSTMIIAPPLAGWAVAVGGTIALLWAEAAGVAIAALLLFLVRTTATVESPTIAQPAPRMRHVLSNHRDLRRAIIISTVGALVWFAFTLGLAILGVQTGQPGMLIAAGLTGYGLGSLAGALVTPSLIHRLPPLPTIVISWFILGLAFAVMPALTANLTLLGVVAGIGGLCMPLGIGALNRLITTETTGAERRAAFAVEGFMHDGAVSLGLLAGGAIIGLVGPGPTLIAAGLAQIAVTVVIGTQLIMTSVRGSRSWNPAG